MTNAIQKKVEEMKDLLGDLKMRRFLKEKGGSSDAIGQYGDNWRRSILYKWLEKNPNMKKEVEEFDEGLQKILGGRFLDYNNALSSFISYSYSKGKQPSPGADIQSYKHYMATSQKQFPDYLEAHKEVTEYLSQNLDKLTEINKNFKSFHDQELKRREAARTKPPSVEELKGTIESLKRITTDSNRKIMEQQIKRLEAQLPPRWEKVEPTNRSNLQEDTKPKIGRKK